MEIKKIGIAGENEQISRLKEVVIQDPECYEKFKEAFTLAKSIFTEYVPLPFFTPHGIKHLRC